MKSWIARVDWESWKFPGYFLLARLLILIALPFDGLLGYGDLRYFFDLASLGKPYLELWVEYPPVFPLLSRGLYLLSGGQRHIYVYLLVTILAISQALTIYYFQRLAQQFYLPSEAYQRTLRYLILTVGFAYGWWYFDPLANLALVAGVYWLYQRKHISAVAAAAAGTLTKLFPALLLVLVWRYQRWRERVWMTALWAAIVVGVFGYLFWRSPEYMRASLALQSSRSSWETVWALVDGNLSTGNFGLLAEHRLPEYATQLDQNPSKIPSGITLIVFGLVGFYLFLKAETSNPRSQVALLGFTWCIFFLWSPAWSPQWVLYLLPWVLLVLPSRQGWLFALSLILVNLMEWPVLLSRGIFQGLWLTIILRTILIALLAWSFWQVIRESDTRQSAERRLPANQV